ncbi:odorant-binding protein 2b-like [Cervus elaphus]|uniref:odorant-binding protein 2b-like n=1 Tax=Cervus elaphus TaxID=9860 RepID=UPI001CC28436|nr:odorant-binding protein 2b-like [Cervus elaphus]XP_043772084.1 odorant-binding protein 2b-like [Cervus elaphus]
MRTGPQCWVGGVGSMPGAPGINSRHVWSRHNLPWTPGPAGSWEPKAPEMKALFLPIALSLLAALRAQDPPSCPLEPQQIAGTWYVKAVVNDKNMPKEIRLRKASPLTLTALGSGDLEVRFTFMKEDQCHEKIKRMQPTGEPGKYSSNGGKKYMSILELPVEGHYILFCQGHIQGKSVSVGKLIGRNPDVSPEALEAFKIFAQRKGFSPEDIFTPEQTESCEPASD